MKKVIVSFIAMLSTLFFLFSGKGYADEVRNIDEIDKYVIVENNQFYLTIPKDKEDDFTIQVQQILKEQNEYIIQNDSIIDPVTKKITNKHSHYRFFSVSDIAYIGEIERFWWGVRKTFYDDATAKRFAHEWREASNQFGILSLILGVTYPPASVISSLGVWYCNSIAESVSYNAELDGDGCVLDITYLFTFSCYPR